MKQAKIEIKNPCVQNWNAMPEVQGGLYCSQCTKVVTDFSKLSDEDLIRILSQKKDPDLCGKFSKHQLEKTYFLETRKSFTYPGSLKFFLAGLLSLPFQAEAQTQSAQKQSKALHQHLNKNTQKSHKHILKGKVIDRATRQGIEAGIQVYSNTHGQEILIATSSDYTGSYEIDLSDYKISKFFKVVYSSSEYYKERFVIIDRDKIPDNLYVSLFLVNTNKIVDPDLYQGSRGGEDPMFTMVTTAGPIDYNEIAPPTISRKEFLSQTTLWQRLKHKLKYAFRKRTKHSEN